MDRAAVSRIAHGLLTLFNPLSDADIDEAIELLTLAPGADVLDVACRHRRGAAPDRGAMGGAPAAATTSMQS